ncbi:unnamed protein product [Symbiodinium sp. CCMP2592]|nr:unnamed protein product [Symbiodinium sp. CCMP2592]
MTRIPCCLLVLRLPASPLSRLTLEPFANTAWSPLEPALRTVCVARQPPLLDKKMRFSASDIWCRPSSRGHASLRAVCVLRFERACVSCRQRESVMPSRLSMEDPYAALLEDCVFAPLSPPLWQPHASERALCVHVCLCVCVCVCVCVFAHDESYAHCRAIISQMPRAMECTSLQDRRQTSSFLLSGVGVKRDFRALSKLRGSFPRPSANSRLTSATPLSSSALTKVRAQGGPLHFSSFMRRERSRQETSATTAANSNTLVVCTALLMP